MNYHQGRHKERFVKIPRKPNESDNKYNRRVKEIKKNSGQSGTSFLGVYTQSPVGSKNVHYSFKGNKLTVTNTNTGFKEWWISLEPMRLATEGYTYLLDIARANQAKGARTVTFAAGGSDIGATIRLRGEADEFVIMEFMDLFEAYGTLPEFITGMVFRT